MVFLVFGFLVFLSQCCQEKSSRHIPYDDLLLQEKCLNECMFFLLPLLYIFSMLRSPCPPFFIAVLIILMDFPYRETKIQHSQVLFQTIFQSRIFHIHATVVLDQFFISQVPLGYCNSNLILQYDISWRKRNIKCYLSRKVILIRSDLSLSQQNKEVSVIFMLAKISFAYSKQKMSLSWGLKFSLEITESHYQACITKLV